MAMALSSPALAPVGVDTIRRALSFVPSEDRDLWVRMGMAVKSELGDAGFAVWDEWSQGAENYKSSDAAAVWRSFKGGPVTIGTLLHEAKQRGYQLNGEANRIDPAEIERYRHERRAAQEKEDAEREARYEQAAEYARDLLSQADGDPLSHPYMVRKKGVPLGQHAKRGSWPQRGWPDALLLPIFQSDAKAWSIEAIPADEGAEKDSLEDARKGGGIYPIGKITGAPRVIIAEGAATAGACYASTGIPTAAALTAGNLKAAARTVLELSPSAEIIFAGDFDPKPNGKNPGKDAAIAAAKALGARVAIADLEGRECDFWDVWSERGPEAVKRAIEEAAPVTESAAPKVADVPHPSTAVVRDPARTLPPVAPTADKSPSIPLRPPRPPIDWLALSAAEPPARRWAIKGWIGFGHVTLLVGQGGIGKTLLAQQIASSLALGLPFVDDVPGPLRVLMWACEDDHDELWRRQVDIARYQDADLSGYADSLVIVPRHGAENTLVSSVYGVPMFTPLIEELREQANDTRADVVILDNIAQLYGAGENDRHAVTMFQNGLSGALGQRAVLLLGHPARAAGSEFSGSSAWENAARTRLYLGDRLPDQQGKAEPGDEPAPDVRYLARRKANYSTRDWRRFNFRDGVLVPDAVEADSAAGGMVGYLRQQQAERVVLEGLKRLQGMGVEAMEASNSPSFLPRLLVEYKLNEGRPRSELAEAMRRLRTDGKIERAVVGKYPNRSPKYGLRPAG